jgi:hypothetical protein
MAFHEAVFTGQVDLAAELADDADQPTRNTALLNALTIGDEDMVAMLFTAADQSTRIKALLNAVTIGDENMAAMLFTVADQSTINEALLDAVSTGDTNMVAESLRMATTTAGKHLFEVNWPEVMAAFAKKQQRSTVHVGMVSGREDRRLICTMLKVQVLVCLTLVFIARLIGVHINVEWR